MPSLAYAQGKGPIINSVTPGFGYTNTVTRISIQGENLTSDIKISIYQEDPMPERGYAISGWAQGVYAQGNYVYVADDTLGLQIIDISQPDQPTVIGTCDTHGWACGLYVQGNYAYVANGYFGIRIIDVSQPAMPVLMGSYDTPGYAYGVYVRGNYAYVADDRSGLQIIDVSQPGQPLLKGNCDTPGSARGVYIAGDYAYMADADSGLQIINISQPDKPAHVGSYDTPGSSLGVFVSGDFAYVADADSGLQIIDISHPRQPVLMGSYYFDPGSGWARGVYVQGNYVYLADGYSVLLMIDVSNPISPTLRGKCSTPGTPFGVFVLGDYAYVADGGSGLQTINIKHLTPDNQALSINCNTPGWAYGTFIQGDYAYVADGDSGLTIVDLGNIDQPTLAGSGTGIYDTPGRAYGVFVAGNYAYVADGDSGLAIIDISYPEKPLLKGTCDTPGQAYGVFVAGDYAYVADGYSGLAVIDITHPDHPVLAGAGAGTGICDTPGSSMGVFVSGNYAYVADGDSGLRIIDVSQPDRPVRVGNIDIPDSSQGVFVTDHYAYVAYGCSDVTDCSSGLAIIDISQPDRPVRAGNYDTSDSCQGVFVRDNYAYVANNRLGLQVIDITDPVHPLLIAHLGQNLTGQALGIFLSQGRIFLASGASGLQILSESCFRLARIEETSPDGTEATATIPSGLPEGFYTVRATNSYGLTGSLSNAFELIDYNPFISILFPHGGEMLKKIISIRWQADQPGYSPDKIAVDIACSPDRGQSWKSLAINEKNDGVYDWNTGTMADGDNYLIKITCKVFDQGEGPSTGTGRIISEAVSGIPFSIANGNTHPQISDITASQQDGLVTISYHCFDQEQTSVNVSFQYWDGSAWRPCRTVTGAGKQQVLAQNQGQASQLLTASWMIRDDFSGHYLPACKIKILADDGQSVDPLAEAQSPSFVLDTIPPKTNASPVGGTYSRWAMVTLAASDDSKVTAIYYTTDGSTPTTASPRFTGPIAVEKSTSLKFFAVDSFGCQEQVKTENYVILKKVTVSVPGAVWPGSSMEITCQVKYTDGSLVFGEPITFTLSVDGSATFDPEAVTGKVLEMNSSRNQALVQTSGGKVIVNLTDNRAEDVSLTVRDTEGMGLEISGTALGLTAIFLDPDLDEDHDGLPNQMETSGCLKVNNADSDADAMPDGYEYNHSCLDPCDPGSTANPAHGPYGDPDGDGVSNLAEYRWSTDPCLKDTDGDGLDDGLEWDINHNTTMSPIDSSQKPCDSDGDGLIDVLDPDSDNDGLPDNKEYFNLKTSYSNSDTDGDGKPDSFEVGADPNHPALCIGDKGKTCLCALDPNNNQQKPVIKSIRPCWSADGTGTLAISGENLTTSTLIAIEQQETPSEVGKCSIEGEASGVCIRGNYAYLAVGTYGLLMIDISQPDHPLVKGNCEFEENAYGVCISGNYACVAAGYAGFLVVDISQPDQPVVKGICNTPGYARGVWTQRNIAYVADEWAGLQIIDFSQPDQPVLKGSLNTPDWAYGVCGQNNYVYVAAGYSGLLAVDVSQPETPVLRASCSIPGCAFGVSVFEGCAYVADSYSSLQLIDITHPGYPFLMTGIKLPGRSQAQVLGLIVSNDYFYLASGSAGFGILTRPSFWLAQTKGVNAAGTMIDADLLTGSTLPSGASGASGLPTGSCTIKALNPPYGEADLFTQVFETAITNTPPQIRNVSAGQRKDGAVAITYDCFDQEQSTVKIRIQYWNGFQWKDGQATSGDGPQSTGSNLTGVWRAKEDFGGQFLTNCLIRIKADDEQSENCLAEAQSPPFMLDTKPPYISVTPLGGDYQTPPTVILSTDETAVIYYTTDGTDPVSGSGTGAGTGSGIGSSLKIYTDPLKLTANTTLKVSAVDSYANKGTIRKEVYTISFNTQPPATGTSQTQGSGTSGVSLPTFGSYQSLYGSVWTSFNPTTPTIPTTVIPSITSFDFSTTVAPGLGSFSSFNSMNGFQALSTNYLYSSSSFMPPSYGNGPATGYGLAGSYGTAGNSNLSLGNYNYLANYGLSSGGLSLSSYNAATVAPLSSYSSPLLSVPYIY